jgi:hypothetical protein
MVAVDLEGEQRGREGAAQGAEEHGWRVRGVELREMRPNEWQRASRRGAALEGLGAER